MKATIARTIILALAMINAWLSQKGMPIIPIEDEAIEQTVSYIFLLVTVIVGWWKNNSFTKAAKLGDALMRKIKLENRMNKRLNGGERK